MCARLLKLRGWEEGVWCVCAVRVDRGPLLHGTPGERRQSVLRYQGLQGRGFGRSGLRANALAVCSCACQNSHELGPRIVTVPSAKPIAFRWLQCMYLTAFTWLPL